MTVRSVLNAPITLNNIRRAMRAVVRVFKPKSKLFSSRTLHVNDLSEYERAEKGLQTVRSNKRTAPSLYEPELDSLSNKPSLEQALASGKVTQELLERFEEDQIRTACLQALRAQNRSSVFRMARLSELNQRFDLATELYRILGRDDLVIGSIRSKRTHHLDQIKENIAKADGHSVLKSLMEISVDEADARQKLLSIYTKLGGNYIGTIRVLKSHGLLFDAMELARTSEREGNLKLALACYRELGVANAVKRIKTEIMANNFLALGNVLEAVRLLGPVNRLGAQRLAYAQEQAGNLQVALLCYSELGTVHALNRVRQKMGTDEASRSPDSGIFEKDLFSDEVNDVSTSNAEHDSGRFVNSSHLVLIRNGKSKVA